MDEIIRNIKEAEERAAEIKAQAYKKAEIIAENAVSEAAKIAAENEAECKRIKDNAVKKATADAQKAYLAAVEKKRGEAEAYADALAKKTGGAVADVVRRITSGSC